MLFNYSEAAANLHISTILATNAGMKGLSIFAILLGLAIRYWLARRAFYRRNSFGIEGFKSYENLRVTKSLERIARLIAFLLIIARIIVVLMLVMTPVHRVSSLSIYI